MATTDSNYVPGVCNINQTETAYRRKAGYVGLALSIVAAMLLVGLGVDRYFRLVVAIPIFISAIGFLQAKNKFCVGYAAASLQNTTEGSTDAKEVSDKKAVAADKKRANALNLQALAITTIVTLLIVVL